MSSNPTRLLWAMCLWLLIPAYASNSPWQLQFEGSLSFSHSELKSQLALPEEFHLLDDDRRILFLKLGRNNLVDFYMVNGFFNNQVEMSIRQEENTWIYQFTISEGPRYQFADPIINTTQGAPDLVALTQLNAVRGEWFNFNAITQDLQIFRETYRRNGYLHIRLDHLENVDSTQHTVQVIYTVEPRHQVRMGWFIPQISRRKQPGDTTTQKGLTDPQWLASLWTIPRNEVIDGDFMADFRSKLLGTQIFSRVLLEDTLVVDGKGLSTIHLHAVERTPGETQMGIFFEETYGFGAQFESKHRNISGHFHEGSVQSLLAQNKQELIFGYGHPLVFGTSIRWIPTAIRLDDRILLSHENIPLPEDPDSLVQRIEATNRSELSFGFSQHIRSRTSLELGYIRRESSSRLRSKLESGLIFDFTDNAFEPTLGLRIRPTLGMGQSIQNWLSAGDLELSNPYPYMEIRSSFYFPIVGPLLGALAYDHGRFFHEAPDDDARGFYQGGSRSVRGYTFRSIYPYRTVMTTDTTVETGRTPIYHRLSEELRFNLPWRATRNMQVVQFIDWTHIRDQKKIYDSSQEMSFGLGFRYRWKVLTLRFDYTLKKDLKHWDPEAFESSRFTFDLSQAI